MQAQNNFTQLDWAELRIDSIVPVYTEVVPLETDYRHYDYRVRVLYPEWAPLTPKEIAVVERSDAQIADTLAIHTHVGISRGRGLLDISFVPIVRRQGKLQKLLSGKIEIQPVLAAASRPSRVRAARAEGERYAANSVLSSGQWYKITVTSDGLYRLTNNALRSMGFSNPANVHVYGYGGHLQDVVLRADTDWDDLEEVALMPYEDGYLFHAYGLEHWQSDTLVVNHYANAAAYFVTETSTPATTIGEESAPAVESASAVPSTDTFAAHTAYNPEEFAWFSGGRKLFENYNYNSGNSRSYTLSLPTYAADGEAAKLTIAFTGSNLNEMEVSPTFNGNELPPFAVSGLAEYVYAAEEVASYSVGAPVEDNTVGITTPRGRYARLDYLTLSYVGKMRLSAAKPLLQFAHRARSGVERFRLEYEEGQSPAVWRLAEPGSPAVALAGTKTDSVDASGVRHLIYQVFVQADGASHQYVAFDAARLSELPAPTLAGKIDNQNLHATEALDYVIITPASGLFAAQAQRLAEAHRALEGMRVGVFRADQIYNEFSSGTPDATAYRRFLKMLYDRAQTDADRPRYLLLFGDCAWDNRMLTVAWRGYKPDDFLLCFESENSYSDIYCYVMEDYFGLLDDGEGRSLTKDKPDLGVGRFPVRTEAEAEALVNKTIQYMHSAHAGAWKNVLVFMGDDGDKNKHLDYADEVAEQVAAEHPEMEVRKVMWDAYARESTSSGHRYSQVRQAILNQMEEGALMMNYTGHASTYTISHEQVLRIEDFANFTSSRVPLWFTAACDVMPFDGQVNNIGETAILNENGAAVAFVGTSRTVYAEQNRPLNQIFCRALFDTDADGRPNRLGDALRISKTANGGSVNNLHFALLGDPALVIGGMSHRVVLDAINDTPVESLPADFTLPAGSQARIEGHIVDAEGAAVDGFEGTLNLRLYDSQNTVTCLNNDGKSDTLFVYQVYDKILYNGKDSVRAGRFVMTCPIPLDINYSEDNGRMLFYAISTDSLTEANGYSERFRLGESTELVDTEGPSIVAYLEKEGFEDGGTVSTTPYFVAQLEDPSGINTSGNGIGHDLELIIDNNAATTYTLNDYFVGEFGDYSRGTVAFSIPALTEGDHRLTFRAWDMLNNPSSYTMRFRVDPNYGVGIVDLHATNSPATSGTTFLVTINRPGALCTFTVEVFDFTGRLLWNHSEQGSSSTGVYAVPWNLTTGSGFPLGSGVYLYRVRVSCDDGEEVSKSKKIIVNRRQ